MKIDTARILYVLKTWQLRVRTLYQRAMTAAGRIPISSVKLPFNIDVYALIGAGIALFVLLFFHLLFKGLEGKDTPVLSIIAAIVIAFSPLLAAYKIEQQTGMKIFCNFADFLIAAAWAPLTLLALFFTKNNAIIIGIMICGYLVDPVWLGRYRVGYPGKTRVMMAYARGLCGILGTLLVVTFIVRLMSIGNSKDTKSALKEVVGAVAWGYCGKVFFDFIGVTQPVDLSGLIPGSKKP